MTTPTHSLSYRDAGVDIDAGNSLVERIKPIAARTRRPEVLAGLGGFGALFEIPLHRYQHPVLVSGTDGVGTKLKLAMQLQKHDSIGIDLVAMCANDLIVQGAEPLFFLDYYATGKLDLEIAAQVIQGIGVGCEQAGMSLVGGETAEMPGMYTGEDYDLAGFCVGIVEKAKLLDGSQVRAGDALVALASSGAHSNGYSLIRKLLDISHADLNSPLPGDPLKRSLGSALLEPTRIYVKSLLKLIAQVEIHALAHITGGGLTENIPRVLPDALGVNIHLRNWNLPPLFAWLQTQGNITDAEMRRTFNCGVGMVICLPQDAVPLALDLLQSTGECAWLLGEVVADASHSVAFV